VKGLAQAGKKAGRVASEGLIAQYIHAGARCAVLRCPVPPARLASQIGCLSIAHMLSPLLI
jgi:hypothetical protein